LNPISFLKKQENPFKVNILKNLVQNFSMGLTQQYQSIYITLLGADPIQLGLITSIGGVLNAAVTIPASHFANRQGIKKALLTSILITAIGYFIIGISNNWFFTIPGLALASLAWGIGMVACPMVCGNCLDNSERATGMQICDTVSALPRLIAPLIAAFIITLFGGLTISGIKPLYWLQVLGLLSSFVIIFKFFDDIEFKNSGSDASLMNDIRGVFKEGIMVKRWIVYIMFSNLPHYMAFYIPLYAKQVKGSDQIVLGMMDAGYWLIIILLAIPSGIWADQMGRKKLVSFYTPIYCLSLVLLIVANSSIIIIIAGLLNGFIMLASVTQGAITAELVPKELLGSWFGLIGLMSGLVNVFSPVLGGFLWETLGPAYLFIFLSASQVLKLPILASIPSKITKD